MATPSSSSSTLASARGKTAVPRGANIAELEMALAISLQHGGRGVAMLVKGEDRYVAVDQSDIWAGHTALLLLLQEISAIPTNPEFYVIGDLSEADLGVFLALVKWHRDRRICRWNGGRLFVHNPAIIARRRVESERALDLVPAPVVILSRPPITGVSLFALLRPTVLRPTRALSFSDLDERCKRLFDYMFLSLCASLITRSRNLAGDLSVSSIGAVIVNEFGEILSYGNDMAAELHAETVTIKRLQGSEGHMPDMTGCRFYTSLEPCLMCSGFIYESCVNNVRCRHPKGFKVVYLQWDPAVHQVDSPATTGIPTILNEAGLYELQDQLPVMYDLEDKRLKLDRLHREHLVRSALTVGDREKRKFEKSATQAVAFLPFRRRFAKMKLRLLAIPALIDGICVDGGPAKDFLLNVWVNILRFLEVDCGQSCIAEMELIAAFLNKTAGTNPLRTGSEEYRLRKRGDFMGFYAQYIDAVNVFHV